MLFRWAVVLSFSALALAAIPRANAASASDGNGSAVYRGLLDEAVRSGDHKRFSGVVSGLMQLADADPGALRAIEQFLRSNLLEAKMREAVFYAAKATLPVGQREAVLANLLASLGGRDRVSDLVTAEFLSVFNSSSAAAARIEEVLLSEFHRRNAVVNGAFNTALALLARTRPKVLTEVTEAIRQNVHRDLAWQSLETLEALTVQNPGLRETVSEFFRRVLGDELVPESTRVEALELLARQPYPDDAFLGQLRALQRQTEYRELSKSATEALDQLASKRLWFSCESLISPPLPN